MGGPVGAADLATHRCIDGPGARQWSSFWRRIRRLFAASCTYNFLDPSHIGCWMTSLPKKKKKKLAEHRFQHTVNLHIFFSFFGGDALCAINRERILEAQPAHPHLSGAPRAWLRRARSCARRIRCYTFVLSRLSVSLLLYIACDHVSVVRVSSTSSKRTLVFNQVDA